MRREAKAQDEADYPRGTALQLQDAGDDSAA